MLNLSELAFKVNTDALVDAANKIAALGKSVEGLQGSFQKLEKTSAEAQKAQAQANKANAEAALANVKTANETLKGEALKEKAIRATTQATEASTTATKNSMSILERQTAIQEFVAAGYTKGQASVLTYAKALGVAKDEIAEIGRTMQVTQSLIGGDPFDKSNNALRSLQGEFNRLKEAQRLFTAEIPLTRKQMDGLAQDKLRLVTIMKSQGASLSQIKAALKELNIQYIASAAGVNRLTAAEEAIAKTHREAAQAAAFLEKEMQRVNFALQEQNTELNKGTANALNRFEQNLKRSGLTLDQQRVKMDEYRKSLLQLEKSKGSAQTDYISRALGPQITDIFVGLATGQSPLTVMLQQGGQLRDQFALAGVAAADMGSTMRTAAREMVTSVAAVAGAFKDLLIGAFIDTGKGISNMVMEMTYMNAVIEMANRRFAAMGQDGFKYIGMMQTAVQGLTYALGGIAMAGLVALVALGVEYYKILKVQNEMTVALAATGASIGLSRDGVIALAESMTDVGVKSLTATRALTEFAKAGVEGDENLKSFVKSAVDLQKYTGIAIEDTAKKYAELQDKPTKALTEIAAKTGFVTAAVLEQVRALEQEGKMAEATQLAQEAFRDSNLQVTAMVRDSLSPIEKLWLDIKSAIGQVSQAMYQVATNTTVVNVFRTAWETVAVIVSEVWYVLKQTGNEIGGIAAQIGAVMSGDFGAAKTIGEQMKSDAAAARAEQDKLVASILNRGKAESTVGQISAEERKRNSDYAKWQERNSSALEKSYSKQEKFELKKIELQSDLNKGIIDEITYRKALDGWKRKILGDEKKGGPSAKANLDVERSNEIRLLEQSFERETSLRQRAMNDQLSIMKSDYEMGYLTKAEYLEKETNLLKSALATQKAESEKAVQARENLYLAETAMLFTAYQERLKANAGLKNQDEADAKALVKLQTELGNSAREYENFIEKVRDKDSALNSSVTAKEVEAMKVLTEGLKEATKAYNDYLTANALRIEQQADTRAMNEALRWATPEQAAVIRAVAEETKYYTGVLAKFKEKAEEAKKVFEDTASRFGVMSPQAMVALKQYQTALMSVNTVVADQRIAEENAASTAIVDYYKQEFDRIRNGISDAIVTALFEGGKAGAKKIRDVIVGVLRQKVTLVVDAVVNTLLGNVIGSLLGGGGGGIGGAVGGGAGGLINAGMQGYSLYSGLTSGTGILGRIGSFLGLGGAGSAVSGAITGAGATGLGLSTGASGLGLSAGGGGLGLTVGSGSGVAAGAGAGASGGLGALATAAPYILAIVAIAASWKKLFGRELKDSGIQGKFGGKDGFEGQAYRFYKGGLFRSDKTELSPIDKALQKQLGDAFTAMKTQVTDFAKVLGLNADKLKNFTSDIKISLHGMNENDISAKIQEALATVNNEMAQEILGEWEDKTRTERRVVAGTGSGSSGRGADDLDSNPAVFEDVAVTERIYKASKYAKEGEKAIDTLTRLATSLSTVNQVFDTLGYKMYEASLAGGDMASKLADLFGGLDKLVASTTFYYQNFYSEAERQATAQRQLEKEFKKNNLTMPKTREEYRKLVEAQDLSTEEGRKMYALLLQLAPAFAEITQTAEEIAAAAKDKLRDALEGAYDALEKAVNAQKELLQQQAQTAQETVNRLKGIFDLLSKNVKELYMQVDSTAKMLASQGRAVIQQALSSGVLPDQKLLEDSISAVRSDIDSTQYATQFEQDKARLQLAAELQILQDQAGAQLSTAELILKGIKDQLEYLDNLLKTAREQIDAALGITNAVMSVEQALKALADILKPAAPDTGTVGKGNNAVAGKPVFGPTGPGPSGPAPKELKPGEKTADGKYVVERYLGSYGTVVRSATDEEQTALQAKEAAYQQAWAAGTQSGNLAEFFIMARDSGISLLELSALAGYYYEDMYKAATSVGVQRFATGGAFTNSVVNRPTSFNMGLMGEAGPEAILPLTNVGGKLGVHASSSSSSDSALESRVDNMSIELQAIAINTSKVARLLERVTRDGESLLITDAATI